MEEYGEHRFYKPGFLEGGSGKSVEVYEFDDGFYVASGMASNPGLRRVEIVRDDAASCEFRFAPAASK